jgi:putative ABC transport system permease protein
MFRHYLITALRSMAASRLLTAISIFGLSVGVAAAILAGIIIRNQTHFDSFIPGSERIYLIALKNTFPGMGADYSDSTPHDLATQLRQNFPQVEAATRSSGAHTRSLMRHGAIEAREDFYWVDANFFQLLPLPVLYGDRDKALQRPDGIVIPLSIARKYFGRANVVGQTLILGHAEPHIMTVSAVIADLPPNASNFTSGIFASSLAAFSSLAKNDKLPGMGAYGQNGLIFSDTETFVRLSARTDAGKFGRDIAATMNHLFRLPRPDTPAREVHLLRLDQMHTSPSFSTGVAERLAILGTAALLILFLACVNFVNLSTSRAARRATEVGIRKTSGASRAALIVQFLGESVLQVGFALCVAVMLVELSLPSVNAFLNSGAVFNYWRDPALALALVFGALIVGILAGAWPAFVLSGLRPATVLKNAAATSSGMVRQLLVAVQFIILILLIIAAITVLQQYRYASRDALRITTDQMLFLRDNKCDGGAFHLGVRALPGVRGTACSSTAVLPEFFEVQSAQRSGGDFIPLSLISVGYGFLEQYGLTPVAGRFFSPSHGDAVPADPAPSMVANYVINETAVRRLGFASPQAAIGQALREPPHRPSKLDVHVGDAAGPKGWQLRNGVVIGVVRDFSLYPRERPIEPTAYSVGWTMGNMPPPFQLLHVKLRGANIPETLDAIDALWAKTGDGTPIQRTFLNAYVQDMVVTVQRQGQAFAALAGIAVLLACLGLFGLSISTAQRRTKEIGIRKAMGASNHDIVLLLLWQFLKPVLWAALIALPLASWLMQRWLSGYAYHVALGPLPFLAAAILAAAIALATVLTHAILTARAVPATALRYE